MGSRGKEAPRGDGWIQKLKFDGYRIQARIEAEEVTLVTRGGREWTDRFPGRQFDPATGSWTIGTLGPGETAILVLMAVVRVRVGARYRGAGAARMDVAPASLTLWAVHQETTLQAEVKDVEGTPIQVPSDAVAWSVAGAALVGVDGEGRLTALEDGSGRVAAGSTTSLAKPPWWSTSRSPTRPASRSPSRSGSTTR